MLRHWRVALGQGMTEYAIIVALIAVSGITVFSYFGGVQRSQVAAITQELAGQESGDMLELAGSYASRAGNAARRDSGLGDYYSGSSGDGSGSGSGGGSGGDGGDIGGGWTPPGGGGGWTPPGWGIEPPGGGMCPATAEQKASGTLYVWAVQTADEGCDDAKEPKPDLILTEAEKALIIAASLTLPSRKKGANEAYVWISEEGGISDVITEGCTPYSCTVTREPGMRIVVHTHPRVGQMDRDLDREWPGHGDVDISEAWNVINVIFTPSGAIRAIERINGVYTLVTLQSSSIRRLDDHVKKEWDKRDNKQASMTDAEIAKAAGRFRG